MEPKPKATQVVCEACGLDWAKHEALMKTSKEKPTLETCVQLLKAELASRPKQPMVWSGSSWSAPNAYSPTQTNWRLI